MTSFITTMLVSSPFPFSLPPKALWSIRKQISHGTEPSVSGPHTLAPHSKEPSTTFIDAHGRAQLRYPDMAHILPQQDFHCLALAAELDQAIRSSILGEGDDFLTGFSIADSGSRQKRKAADDDARNEGSAASSCPPSKKSTSAIARDFLFRRIRDAKFLLPGQSPDTIRPLYIQSPKDADASQRPLPDPAVPKDAELQLQMMMKPLPLEPETDKSGTIRNSRSRAPFKATKSNRGTSSWQLKQFAEATLGSGSLRKAVKLPEGEDKDEWLAVNVVDFYNQMNLLYGSITEFCSPQSCPEMKATDEFEYLWQDADTYKRPTKMPAPEYIEHLMAWVQSNVDNEQIFPSRIGVPFPKTFQPLVKQIFKRLYRVYAHIYCHHYPVVVQLGLEPHLNTSFKHYVLFIDEHGLASGKDFWGPLGDLVESMLKGGD